MGFRFGVALLVVALLLFPAVVVADPLPDPQVAQVRSLLRANDVDAAASQGEALVKARPEHGPAWLVLGDVYGRKAMQASLLGKPRWAGKCRDAYESAVRLMPQDPQARYALLQYYARAPGFLGGGAEKAQSQVDALTAIGPAWGHLGRAALLQIDSKGAQALLEYEAAFAADPANYRTTLSLISVHISEKRFAEARKVAAQALERDPSDAVALYMTGRIAIEDGQLIEQGIENLDAYLALERRPDELPVAAAWWRRGLLLEKSGRREDAVESINKAVLLDANLEGAKKDLDRLRS